MRVLHLCRAVACLGLSCGGRVLATDEGTGDGPLWPSPVPGEHSLRVLSPKVLELTLINAKEPDPAPVDRWDLVDTNFQFQAPSPEEFIATVDGHIIPVSTVGFKRRPRYAPLAWRDLRVGNALYLELNTPIDMNGGVHTVAVLNPSARLWATNESFISNTDPFRFSPAVHVNQEGYLPAFPKKAMVGFYLGNLGELAVPTKQFQLVDARTGVGVYQGALIRRPDVGYQYTPTPYQEVYEADFSGYTNSGKYRLVVPGIGASLPFLIDEGVAMNFARAYALGLYHQRCGASNALPFTRFTHDVCHFAPPDVPSPQANFMFTWNTISNYAASTNLDNPPQIAPRLTNEAAQLYPFVNKGKLDARGGHHDAGDYSKYTVNSAALVHCLVFAVDAFPGVAALDNLGLPESGDGISDLLQEAKWEADYLARIQDADGGFYFLVYPADREYESDLLPDSGIEQVVWPKNTAATAAAVAALAQCASSARFQHRFPDDAARYLQQAKRGWDFLTNAIARHGKDGAYQKLTPYGDEFTHNDELAWAACELFLATGDRAIHQTLQSWLPDPADPATFRWGWWRMYAGYGNAVRSYAFAVRTGRLRAAKLDPNYLARCVTAITNAAVDVLTRAQQNAYGTSFPVETKRVLGAGWYFSSAQAFDITTAYQLDPRADYLDAILSNLNFEAGCNPVNVCYVTGLGWNRPRVIVNQYAENDRRVLPPSGLPLGNIQAGFPILGNYGTELPRLCFPSDRASAAPYPFYDRWGDTYNTATEYVIVDQARSLASLAFLAAQTNLRNQSWCPVAARIVGLPGIVSSNVAVSTTLQVSNLDLTGARIIWEARDQQPVCASNFTFLPVSAGSQWVEAEAQWPDGRRIFAAGDFVTTNDLPTVSVAVARRYTSEDIFAPSVLIFTRTGSTAAPLTVFYRFDGTATKWLDYRRIEQDLPESMTIPAGAVSTALVLYPVKDNEMEDTETVRLALLPDGGYNIGKPASGTFVIADSMRPVSVANQAAGGTTITWSSAVGYIYRVVGKDDLDASWTDLSGSIIATGKTTSWTDHSAARRRFYAVRIELPDSVKIAGIARGPGSGMTLTWTSVPGDFYRVVYKNNLNDTNWTDLSGNISATSWTTSWTDPAAAVASRRFYAVCVNVMQRPSISSLTPIHGGGRLVTWTSVPDKVYRVMCKSGLTQGSWMDLSGKITAKSTTTSWPDYSAAGVPQRFYSISLDD